QKSNKKSPDPQCHIEEKSFRKHPDHIICGRVKHPQIIVEKQLMENDKAPVKVHGNRNSKSRNQRQKHPDRDLTSLRQNPFEIRLQNEQKHYRCSQYNRRISSEGKPSKKQIPDLSHMEPVLFIEKVLTLPINRSHDGKLLPVSS